MIEKISLFTIFCRDGQESEFKEAMRDRKQSDEGKLLTFSINVIFGILFVLFRELWKPSGGDGRGALSRQP